MTMTTMATPPYSIVRVDMYSTNVCTLHVHYYEFGKDDASGGKTNNYYFIKPPTVNLQRPDVL